MIRHNQEMLQDKPAKARTLVLETLQKLHEIHLAILDNHQQQILLELENILVWPTTGKSNATECSRAIKKLDDELIDNLYPDNSGYSYLVRQHMDDMRIAVSECLESVPEEELQDQTP